MTTGSWERRRCEKETQGRPVLIFFGIRLTLSAIFQALHCTLGLRGRGVTR